MAVARMCRPRGSRPTCNNNAASPNWHQFGLFAVWRLGNSCCGGGVCIGVQLCALCHAHQGVAPCTRLQPSCTQGTIRTTMRAVAWLPQPLAHQPQNPNSKTRATPSARCYTKPEPRTLRPGLSWPVPASSTARATTTPPSPMSVKRFASIWNAAFLHMALPGRGVMTADTTTSWPIPARAEACAPRATPGA